MPFSPHPSFHPLLIFLLIFMISSIHHVLASRQQQQHRMVAGKEMEDKFAKLRVPPEQFDKVKNLHENLYYGAVKALLGQLGKGHYGKVGEGERRRLAMCLDRVESRFDLVAAAKCLVESRERHLEWEEELRKAEEEEGGRSGVAAFAQELAQVEIGRFQSPQKSSRRLEKLRKKLGAKAEKVDEMMEGSIVAKNGKNRLEKYGGKRRKRMKRGGEGGMEERKGEQGGGMDIEEMRRMRQKLEGMEEKREEYKIRSITAVPPLASKQEKTLASRLSNLLLNAIGPKRAANASMRWTKAQKTLERLAGQIEQSKQFPGTRVYEKRMYDIVLDRDEPSLSPKERRSPLGLLQEGMKLIGLIPGGQNGAAASGGQSASHNVRMFSPRFMPLAPDKGGPAHPSSVLSPTLLAMYEEKGGETANNKNNHSVANVPEMLRKAGVSEKDRQGIIATLMELTGTTGQVEKALGLLQDVDFFKEGVGPPLMKATDRVLNAFFSLEDSLDGRQREDCRVRGFTFAHGEQVNRLLRDQAVDGEQLPPQELARFERYDRMSAEEKELALWATVEQIAGIQHPRRRRVKRTFPPHIFEPFILSPFQFAPTFGLVVFGPVILSPSTFSPYILAPSLFSPLILSPPIFSPLVLSPSLASPWIVTPGVANPYIISPYIFGPFILGPLVLHPFILSPYAISPNVLNPYVLSPIVLNPIALSPDILSPQVLGGAVLSPAMLSPAILTQTYLMVSIFSPTFLS